VKVYAGDRTIDGIVVSVGDDDLPTYQEVRSYDTGGFEWGYEGSAPSQLAFALLYDHTYDTEVATGLQERLMREVIANLGNNWEITSSDLDEFLWKRNGKP